MGLSERFQIYPLIPPDREQVIILLFIVPDKQVLGIPFGIGQIYRVQLLHVENGLVFRDLIGNALPGQVLIGF